MTPLIKSHTLGHPFVPPPDHAGGLRYHAMAPLISHLKELGELEAVAYGQTECFEAGVLFAQAEGILPAGSRLVRGSHGCPRGPRSLAGGPKGRAQRP